MEYGAAVAPSLEKVGGRIVWAGEPAAPLLGEGAGTWSPWSNTRAARPSST